MKEYWVKVYFAYGKYHYRMPWHPSTNYFMRKPLYRIHVKMKPEYHPYNDYMR